MNTRWMWTLVAAAVATVVSIAAPSTAQAAPRVAVIGDETGGVTKAVRKALDSKVDLVDVDGSDVEELARENNLAAVVVVEVGGSKKKGHATITLFQGRDGKELASYVVKGRRAKLARAAGGKAWTKLSKGIKKAKAPKGQPEETPEETPVAAADEDNNPYNDDDDDDDDDDKRDKGDTSDDEDPPGLNASASARSDSDSDSDSGSDGGDVGGHGTITSPSARPWLVVAVDGRPFARSLRYNDDLNESMRSYDLSAPAVGVSALWRPLKTGMGRMLAVRAQLELALGVSGSETSDGVQYGTSASEWGLGVRGEVSLAGMDVAADLGYGEHRFSLDDDEMAELVPDVAYKFLRLGIAVQRPLSGKLGLDVAAGWRQLIGTGDLGSDAWFPRQSGSGIDVDVGVTWQATRSIVVFARADVRRYFFAMNPEPGDAIVVGGAVDQYLAGIAGLSLALR